MMAPLTLSVVFIVVLGLTGFNALDHGGGECNRLESRLDSIEGTITDMKEYLRQRLNAMDPRVPKDCQEAYTMGLTSSGVYRIAPEPNTHIDVYCEQGLSGGGWTVFQVRKDASVDFYKDWNAYKQGFGDLTGNFWLGNTNLHLLTKQGNQELKVELKSPEGEVKFADYSHFSIAPEADNFRLSVSGYTSGTTPGDSLIQHNGSRFNTKDRDSRHGCARLYRGAWWFEHSCYHSNLNGPYGSKAHARGVCWASWGGLQECTKFTRMMLRRKT